MAQNVQSTPASTEPFDIVSTYNHLLATDPDLTMPVAAIESLITLLSTTPLTTISETLALLSTASAKLKSSIANPISLSAGTDLFQRYLITQLQHRAGPGRHSSTDPAGDFKAIRTHLLANGRLFVQRAKAGRGKIARFARGFIRDSSTVLTNGGSRVVGSLLKAAASEQQGGLGPRFRVIYVLDSPTSPKSFDAQTIRELRELHVPVAVIPFSALAYSLSKISLVIVGAEGVVENGGIINKLGTYQLGMLAKMGSKPFYVVAESHKFVRMYPLGQEDLGLRQQVLEFKTSNETSESTEEVVKDLEKIEITEGEKGEKLTPLHQSVDFTPPDLISALITENGVLTPSAVSEELIKMWF